MIAERLRDSLAARRAGALLLLALLAWVASPVVLAPVAHWRENRAEVAREAEIQRRLERLEARRAAIAAAAIAAAAAGDGMAAGFVEAPDGAAALAAMEGRLRAAALPDAMRIDGVAPGPVDERPGAALTLRFGFTATQGALQAFLADIEAAPPFLRVDELVASPLTQADGAITLAGTAAVSAVPLLRGKGP